MIPSQVLGNCPLRAGQGSRVQGGWNSDRRWDRRQKTHRVRWGLVISCSWILILRFWLKAGGVLWDILTIPGRSSSSGPGFCLCVSIVLLLWRPQLTCDLAIFSEHSWSAGPGRPLPPPGHQPHAYCALWADKHQEQEVIKHLQLNSVLFPLLNIFIHCRKFGRAWEEYTRRVTSNIIPYVYWFYHYYVWVHYQIIVTQ